MSKGRNKLSHIQRTAGFDQDYQAAEEATKLPQTVLEAELIAGDPDKGKRFRKGGGVGHIVRKPHLDVLLGAAYSTMWSELSWFEQQARIRRLDADEARRFVQMIDALSKLSKTERDANKDDNEELTKEELLERAKEALKFMEGE